MTDLQELSPDNYKDFKKAENERLQKLREEERKRNEWVKPSNFQRHNLFTIESIEEQEEEEELLRVEKNEED